jgi:hypothetical protein
MLWVTLLAAAASMFLALFWLTPIGVPALQRLGGGKPSPDLTFGYTAAATYRLLDLYGESGIAHWKRLLLLDMMFPAVYGALLALLAHKWALWIEAGPGSSVVAIASPLAAAACDYVENILLLRVIAALPRKLPGTVRVSSAFTRLKFIFVCATLLIPLAHWAGSALHH